ncbi:MAG: hypothetical protein WA208_19085 [Thermoanaerobaculia bacterium]
MIRNHKVSIALTALLALVLLATGACKSSGVAVTSRGQVLKLDIQHPTELPENGEDNLDVVVRNHGVNHIQDVVVDVEIPPQLVVLDQTNERGINVSHTPGTNLYHFTFGNIQATESSTIRFRVRTSFGSFKETGEVKATAWQSGLPGDKLVETALIKLRQ